MCNKTNYIQIQKYITPTSLYPSSKIWLLFFLIREDVAEVLNYHKGLQMLAIPHISACIRCWAIATSFLTNLNQILYAIVVLIQSWKGTRLLYVDTRFANKYAA